MAAPNIRKQVPARRERSIRKHLHRSGARLGAPGRRARSTRRNARLRGRRRVPCEEEPAPRRLRLGSQRVRDLRLDSTRPVPHRVARMPAAHDGTKAFIESLSFALRRETRNGGVTVTCLVPGATATELLARRRCSRDRPGRGRRRDERRAVRHSRRAAPRESRDARHTRGAAHDHVRRVRHPRPHARAPHRARALPAKGFSYAAHRETRASRRACCARFVHVLRGLHASHAPVHAAERATPRQSLRTTA